jgi:hypothetical protein
MNLDMANNVNFNIISMFLLKNTLNLDFKNGLSTTHLAIM